jgi:hypothetical protein
MAKLTLIKRFNASALISLLACSSSCLFGSSYTEVLSDFTLQTDNWGGGAPSTLSTINAISAGNSYLRKEINVNGGLAALAAEFFENVEANDDGSFIGSHDIMTSIKGSFSDTGALVIDVKNSPPNFDDPEAMKIAQDSRKKWTQFLDAATGYNSKQRGDKAKE